MVSSNLNVRRHFVTKSANKTSNPQTSNSLPAPVALLKLSFLSLKMQTSQSETPQNFSREKEQALIRRIEDSPLKHALEEYLKNKEKSESNKNN